MNQIIMLQASLFGSFDNIKLDPVLASKLINEFGNKLMPSTVKLATLNPMDGRLYTEDRLNMVSSDEEVSIAFLPNRIDANYAMKNTPLSACDIEKKLDELQCYLSTATTYFSEVGNRLAINGRFINTEIPFSADNYFKLNGFFSGKDLAEWSLRTNTITHFTIAESDEDVNNILELSLSHNVEGDVALMVSFDINTSATRNNMRFSDKSLPEFFVQALANLAEMVSSYR